jgi:monoamine oxidase
MGKARGAIYRERGSERRVEGDFLLCTLPCPVLSRIEVQPELSGPKWRAIRELTYDSSTKVLAVTRRRFWESDDGIYGGGTYTDLPTVMTYYPPTMPKRKARRFRKAPA